MPNYTLDDGVTVKNNLGASSPNELEAAEAKYVANRLLQCELGHGPKGALDSAHLKAIHQHLFQDVYEWAGHTRDERVALADGTIASEPLLRKMDGKSFMAGPLIADALDRIASQLRDANYFRDLPREQFAERAADVMVELNGVHPFREGNGRTQRMFMRELAQQAGHKLDFSVVSRERMVQASIAGNEDGDPAMMRRMFREISNPSRVAALAPAIEFLSQQGFPWNDRYVATVEPGDPLDVTIAGIAGEHFMARTESGIVVGQIADLPTPLPTRGAVCHVEPSRWPEPEENRAAAKSDIGQTRLERRQSRHAAAPESPTRDVAEGRGDPER